MTQDLIVAIVSAGVAAVSLIVAFTRMAAQAPLKARVEELTGSIARLQTDLSRETERRSAAEAETESLRSDFLSLKSGKSGALLKNDIDTELKIAMNVLRATASSVYVLEPSPNPANFVFLSLHGPGTSKIRLIRMPITKGKVGSVYRTGQLDNYSFRHEDIDKFKGVDKKVDRVTETMLTVPLIASGRTVGIAQFLNKRDGVEFDSDDERTAARLAQSLAEKTAYFIGDRVNFEVLGLSSQQAGTDATVLFCDLTSSSTLFRHLTVPTAVSCINEYLERQSEIAFKHNGTVDKYIGDGIMFRFNVPRQIREREHVSVAIEAAVEMRMDFIKLKQSWLEFDHPVDDVFSRTGIACGEVFLGTVGHPANQSITIIGEPVNRAAHICESAPRDRNVIVIDEEARRRMAPAGRLGVRPVAVAPQKGTPLETFEIFDEPRAVALGRH